MKNRCIIIISISALVCGGGILMAMNTESNRRDNCDKRPFFNKIGIIEGKDDRRWEEAIVTAVKLPLGDTTNKTVLDIFGANPTKINYDGGYEYAYTYPCYFKNTEEKGDGGIDNGKKSVVLFFLFDQENKLQRVGLRFEPCAVPAYLM